MLSAMQLGQSAFWSAAAASGAGSRKTAANITIAAPNSATAYNLRLVMFQKRY
jgi:hypothetical protein